MQTRRRFVTQAAVLAGGAALLPAAHASSEGDAASGVRAALQRGALSAVNLLGRPDGFFGNPKVRIPLPPALSQAAKVLQLMGQQHRLDELVLAMNRAAEAAVPEAKGLLVQAVKSISVEDALSLVRGSETAVTEFFERKTREPLGERFLPIVTRATQRVRAAQQYDELAGRAASLGLMQPGQASVERYVTGKSLDGLYLMIGDEERRIRRDPVGTGSELLRRVFGGG